MVYSQNIPSFFSINITKRNSKHLIRAHLRGNAHTKTFRTFAKKKELFNLILGMNRYDSNNSNGASR